MKRYEMIKDQEYFGSIIKKGRYKKDKFFVIYYIYNEKKDRPNFGIAIRNNFGNAVIRNKAKRQMRSIIDNNKKEFKNNVDYIIMIRNESKGLKYELMEESIRSLLKGIKYEEKK